MGGCSRCRDPPPYGVLRVELKKLRSRLRFEPVLLLERLQKRQNEECSKILEPGGGRGLFGDFGMSKKVVKKRGALDKKWELERG